MTIEIDVTLKCETTSIQELETYPILERDYKRYRGGQYSVEYKGKRVYLVKNFLIEDEHLKSNIIYTESDILNSLEIDVSQTKYWTILDTPKPAKIELEDSKKTIIPGMLMTVTSNGNEAPLVFFPMSTCCRWSDRPNSINSTPDYWDYFHFAGGKRLIWEERPFAKIMSLFSKGKKFSAIQVIRLEGKVDTHYLRSIIRIW
jgi:hypothetical protein